MVSFEDISVAILAGGMGSRLRPVVSDKPKALVELNGRPFLSYILDQLVLVRVQRVILCIGHFGDMVREYYGDMYKSIQLLYSREFKPLGTGGALSLADPLLSSDPILVLNGDSYIDVDLTAFLEWFSHEERIATILLTKVPDTSRYGKVTIGNNGQVLSFKEKGVTKGPGWINAGIYLMRRQLIKKIPGEKAFSLEYELFPTLIGHNFYGYKCNGRFLDIGTPDSYAAAESFFAPDGIRKHDYQ